MRRALPLCLPLCLLSAACAPSTTDQAERMCLEEARAARAPRGEVAVGGGSGGMGARVSVAVSANDLRGRDPAKVFDACVVRRSGNPPSRALDRQPGWRG